MPNFTPVKKYWLKCTLGGIEHEYNILAKDSDRALTFISRETDWDTVTLRKLSGVVAMAQYGARCINGETESEYLYYHARPV
jgi:hypothetical protein